MSYRGFLIPVLAFATLTLPHCRASEKTESARDHRATREASCTIQTPLKPGIPGSPGNPITSKINPNGDSELSSLMRKMLNDLNNLRGLVLSGSSNIPQISGHERILCTWPTQPDIRGELFGSLSKTYLSALQSFESQQTPDKHSYNAVVAGCLGCHNSFCPGPIHLIQSLWIESSATNPK